MKNTKYYICVFLLASCTTKVPDHQNEVIAKVNKPHSGVVTVIFENLEEVKQPNGPYTVPFTTLFNGYYTDIVYNPTSDKGKKTFFFNLLEPKSLLNYMHIDSYTYSYLVEPNDTIHIRFENNIPIASSTNTSLTEYDLNSLAKFKIQHLQNTKFYNFTFPLTSFMPKEQQFTSEEYQEILNFKSVYLDSLYQQGLLSADVLTLKKKEMGQEKLYVNYYKKDYEYPNDFFEDDALLFGCYNYSLNWYIHVTYGKMFNYDICKIFDAVVQDQKLPIKTKLNYLYGQFKEISQTKTKEELDAKVIQFLTLTNDSIWTELVDKLDRLEIVDSKDLILYDIQMNKIKFDDLVATSKGKVIYIDLWASWCAPCIASFPASKELKEEYKDKAIIFLYLGYNDLPQEWQAKNKEHQLHSGNSHSYLIASPNAEWLKKLQVKYIPRYLLYNKDGKLVNRNAPSPKNENIRAVLNELLK